jgi:hypothetical protein
MGSCIISNPLTAKEHLRMILGGIHLANSSDESKSKYKSEASKSVDYRDAEMLDKAAQDLELNSSQQIGRSGREGLSGGSEGFQGPTTGSTAEVGTQPSTAKSTARSVGGMGDSGGSEGGAGTL